jgi:CRISPR-associated endonuclease/helicase Cas3
VAEGVEPKQSTAQDNEEEADDLSQVGQWLSVLSHTWNVCRKLEVILKDLELPGTEPILREQVTILRLAARWHDRGKAHSAFQAKLKPEALASAEARARLRGQPAAKAPGKPAEKNAWKAPLPKQAITGNTAPDGRRRGFRHELASALAILETLRTAKPNHAAFAWPEGLSKPGCGGESEAAVEAASSGDPLGGELAALSPDDVNLLVYLVLSHHGKVRMSLRSSPDDERTDVPDPCPGAKRQARGVRDGDVLIACQLPATDLNGEGISAFQVELYLDPMEIGLSPRYGASWRERVQMLLERLGPFRLAYLESLLRAADCRASAEEDRPITTPAEGA